MGCDGGFESYWMIMVLLILYVIVNHVEPCEICATGKSCWTSSRTSVGPFWVRRALSPSRSWEYAQGPVMTYPCRAGSDGRWDRVGIGHRRKWTHLQVLLNIIQNAQNSYFLEIKKGATIANCRASVKHSETHVQCVAWVACLKPSRDVLRRFVIFSQSTSCFQAQQFTFLQP